MKRRGFLKLLGGLAAIPVAAKAGVIKEPDKLVTAAGGIKPRKGLNYPRKDVFDYEYGQDCAREIMERYDSRMLMDIDRVINPPIIGIDTAKGLDHTVIAPASIWRTKP